MQLEGSTSVLSADDEAAVRVLDGAGVFNAIQLGEWGYHYHRLRTDPNWMRDVLGKDFEAQRNRFLRPPETQGYEPVPKTRREAYDQLRQIAMAWRVSFEDAAERIVAQVAGGQDDRRERG